MDKKPRNSLNIRYKTFMLLYMPENKEHDRSCHTTSVNNRRPVKVLDFCSHNASTYKRLYKIKYAEVKRETTLFVCNVQLVFDYILPPK